MARKLKVFRTPTGFHDAYVAAPSRKAALAAWGTDHDLFARGAAEEVTDAALMRAPLASPGTVIKVARGTDAEHLASATAKPDESATRAKGAAPAEATPTKARPRKPLPRPSRAKLDEADRAVADAMAARDAGEEDFRARETRLARERRAFVERQSHTIDTLTARRDREAAALEQRLDRWREQVKD